MPGLRDMCKLFGQMTINGTLWVWDYAKDKPVKKSEQSKADWAASEKAKFEQLKNNQP